MFSTASLVYLLIVTNLGIFGEVRVMFRLIKLGKWSDMYGVPFHIYYLNCRYLQFIWRYLQFIWRYLQFNWIYLQIYIVEDIYNSFGDIYNSFGDTSKYVLFGDISNSSAHICNSIKGTK